MVATQGLEVPHRIISAGVDWLTATAYRTSGNEPFRELAKQILEDEARAGNEVRAFASQGYRGEQCGGARFGVRHDTWLLQLSSDVSHARWREVYALATNISRIDVEVTIELEEAQSSFIREQHQSALSGKVKNGRRGDVKLIQSLSDGDSLYLGKRSSDIYARHYDKGKESKLCDAGRVLRFELEYKREQAKQCARVIYSAEHEPTHAAGIVSGYFRSRGLRVASKDSEWRWDASSLTKSDEVKKLRWLRSSVAPSVEWLIQNGKRDEVLRALGLD